MILVDTRQLYHINRKGFGYFCSISDLILKFKPKGKESFDYLMNCKSHFHLGKFKNFLLCTFLKIQDFCIFPIRLQTNL